MIEVGAGRLAAPPTINGAGGVLLEGSFEPGQDLGRCLEQRACMRVAYPQAISTKMNQQVVKSLPCLLNGQTSFIEIAVLHGRSTSKCDASQSRLGCSVADPLLSRAATRVRSMLWPFVFEPQPLAQPEKNREQ